MLDDLKHALRLYRRTPAASLIVVAVLAVGMAFVAAFLSLYSDLILRPEPGFERRGGRIVSVGASDGRNAGGLPVELLERMAEEVSTLDALAGVSPQQFRMDEDTAQVMGELVTRQFFRGIRPVMALGEGFTESQHDAEGEPVVVISWHLWQEKFGGRPDVLGQILRIDGAQTRTSLVMAGPGMPAPPPEEDTPPTNFRIVGVMGRDYGGSLGYQSVPQTRIQFWLPFERGLSMTLPAGLANQPTILRSYTFRGVGRLKPGSSEQAVVNEMTARFGDEAFLQQRAGMKYEVMDRIVQNIFVQRSTEKQLRMFLVGSALLALVAAANVSLFLLARAPGRRRELGIRMAVGAPLRRLARQLASEAALLAVVAGVLGIGLSLWLASFLRGLPFLRQAQWYDVTLLDWRVLALVGVFLLLLTALVSLAPILGLKKMGIAASSRQVSARATVVQRIAGTAQIAVAGVLGGAALAFAWHLAALLLEYPGFRTELRAFTYSMNLPTGTIVLGPDGNIPGMVDAERRREAFSAIPGVTAVSMGSSAPFMQGSSMQTMLPDPDDPQTRVPVFSIVVDGNYVDVLGMRLLPGSRDLGDSEPGAVLPNQTFARRFFGREDVMGEPVPSPAPGGRQGGPGQQVIGVLQDLSYSHPLNDINPSLWTRVGTGFNFGGVVLLDTTLPPSVLQKQVEEVARTLDLRINGNVTTLGEARSAALAPDRARGFLTIFTALLVVLLAGFGFYGTQRYLVTAGRREYAIRASLGCGPRALGQLVLKRGLMLGLPGLVLGVPLAFILVSWLRDDYVSRSVSPLVVTLGVAVGLLALLLLASLGPARMARRTQPAPLLRED